MTIHARLVPYARETAICVDLAYDTMEEEIRAEMVGSSDETHEALNRLLQKLHVRRKLLEEFKGLARKP